MKTSSIRRTEKDDTSTSGQRGKSIARRLRSWFRPNYRRPALILLLLPLLSLILGFQAGPQSDQQALRRATLSVPETSELLLHPTVASSATYDQESDSWLVLLTEEESGTELARLSVDDETGEASEAEVYPIAQSIAYPNLSKLEAGKLAFADPEVRSELLEHGPFVTYSQFGDGEWTVRFVVEEGGPAGGATFEEATEEGQRRKEVARVGIDDESYRLEYVWTGDQIGWPMVRGERIAYGKQANYWFAWGSLALLFALAFVRADKLYSLRNADVGALLGLLVSQGFFRAGESYWAVVLWYPPLVYLLARTLLVGFGVGERVRKTTNLPTPALFIIATLASGLVFGLNLESSVSDVGFAGATGAERIMSGVIPYGNISNDVAYGDTYGPLNYLLYVPFLWLLGWSGEGDFLAPASAVTAVAFVVAGFALLVAGRRYAGGTRDGAALLFAWTVFPYTLYATNNNTNDVIVAAVAAVGLAMATSPVARGASVVAGFAIKLYPLVLIPLWMLHDGPRRKDPMLGFALGGVAVVLLSFWVLALDGDLLGGFRLFYENTIAYQRTREAPWTIFAQVPQLGFLQQPLTLLAILLAFIVAVVPGKRTVRRLAAFSAALVIAFQLTANYWFYTYVPWFEPFVFVALLLATNEKTILDGGGGAFEKPARHPSSSGKSTPEPPAESHPRSKSP